MFVPFNMHHFEFFMLTFAKDANYISEKCHVYVRVSIRTYTILYVCKCSKCLFVQVFTVSAL